MQQDVAPELLNRIEVSFLARYHNDPEIKALKKVIDDGKGTYKDAQKYAELVGDVLGEVYKDHLNESTLPNGCLYRNIAEKILPPTLGKNYELVTDVTEKVQQALNEKAGLGLKAQVPERDTDREDGLIDYISDHEDKFTQEKAEELAYLAENYTQQYVDRSIEKNADFQYDAGLSPVIERDALAECCSWCLDLAGTYKYPLKDRTVFQRHKCCRCTVEYDPKNGKRQNAHTKQWRESTDSDILNARKTANLEPLTDPDRITERKNVNVDRSDFKSVYLDYKREAHPQKGDFIIPDNRTMKNREEDNMRLLYNTFGGDIEALREIKIPNHKNPDFKWRGKYWEEQEPQKNSRNAVDKNMQEAIHQIRELPGGIIFDVGSSSMKLDEIIDVCYNRLRRSATFDCDLVIIRNGKIEEVLRYKK